MCTQKDKKDIISLQNILKVVKSSRTHLIISSKLIFCAEISIINEKVVKLWVGDSDKYLAGLDICDGDNCAGERQWLTIVAAYVNTSAMAISCRHRRRLAIFPNRLLYETVLTGGCVLGYVFIITHINSGKEYTHSLQLSTTVLSQIYPIPSKIYKFQSIR